MVRLFSVIFKYIIIKKKWAPFYILRIPPVYYSLKHRFGTAYWWRARYRARKIRRDNDLEIKSRIEQYKNVERTFCEFRIYFVRL